MLSAFAQRTNKDDENKNAQDAGDVPMGHPGTIVGHIPTTMRQYRDALFFGAWIQLRIALRPVLTADAYFCQADISTKYDCQQSQQQ